MAEAENEITLRARGAGSTGVRRQGNVVLRPASPWTPTVHSLLRHLEEVGFTGAPRVVGSGFAPDGRETLSYIEGEFTHPGPWTIEDDIAEREGLPSLEVRARQLRAIVDAYGLSTTQRRGLVDRIIGYAIHDTAEQADAFGVTLETVDPMPDGFPDHLGADLAGPVRGVDIPQSRHIGESNQVVVGGEMASQVHLEVRWRRYTSSTRWDAFHRSTRPYACQALPSRPR